MIIDFIIFHVVPSSSAYLEWCLGADFTISMMFSCGHIAGRQRNRSVQKLTQGLTSNSFSLSSCFHESLFHLFHFFCTSLIFILLYLYPVLQLSSVLCICPHEWSDGEEALQIGNIHLLYPCLFILSSWNPALPLRLPAIASLLTPSPGEVCEWDTPGFAFIGCWGTCYNVSWNVIVYMGGTMESYCFYKTILIFVLFSTFFSTFLSGMLMWR